MLLHIVAFWLIFTLKNKLEQIKITNPNDIIQLLEHYLAEIKEENKQLRDELDNNISSIEENKDTIHQDLNKRERNQAIEDKELAIEKDDLMETSMEAKILHLHHQKFSPAEIARKLNCGKTEVELIIKFHDKKEY